MKMSPDKERFEKWFAKHPEYADRGREFKFLLWNAWLAATLEERTWSLFPAAG